MSTITSLLYTKNTKTKNRYNQLTQAAFWPDLLTFWHAKQQVKYSFWLVCANNQCKNNTANMSCLHMKKITPTCTLELVRCEGHSCWAFTHKRPNHITALMRTATIIFRALIDVYNNIACFCITTLRTRFWVHLTAFAIYETSRQVEIRKNIANVSKFSNTKKKHSFNSFPNHNFFNDTLYFYQVVNGILLK